MNSLRDRILSGGRGMVSISRHLVPYVKHVGSYLDLRSSVSSARIHLGRRMNARVLHLVDAARRDEQERIARDVHDQIGQDIACIKLSLYFLQPHVESDEGRVRLSQALRLTEGLAGSLRQLIDGLHLAEINQGDFVPILKAMAHDWSESSGIEAKVLLADFEDCDDPTIGMVLFRVCQECLTNVSKHTATATGVTISLHRTKNEIILSVEDDGEGFPVCSSRSNEIGSNQNRYGIVGMRERLAVVGGTIAITSSRSNGTQIVAKVPLQEG